jgi:hypothetical protein
MQVMPEQLDNTSREKAHTTSSALPIISNPEISDAFGEFHTDIG